MLQLGKMVVPELTKLRAEPRYGCQIDPIEPPCSVASYRHQLAFPQDRQMLRNGWPGNRKFRSDLASRALTVPDQRQDLPPSPVGDSP